MDQEKGKTPVALTRLVPAGRRLYRLPVIVMHWISAVVMLAMLPSSWRNDNDDVITRGLHFSLFWRPGDCAAWSLNWHFAGMWFLALNGRIYLIDGFVNGCLRKRLLPIRPSEMVQTVVDTLHVKIAHEDITAHNAMQRLLAICKPIQFTGLVSLLRGFQSARVLHFADIVVIVGFLIVHVALAALVPKTLWAMVAGGPRLKPHGRAEGNPAT